MKKFSKYLYYIRIFFFIIHFIFLFLLLENIISTGIIGFLFIIIDLFFSLIILNDLLKKKNYYQKDWTYNLMKIGFDIYLGILCYYIVFSERIIENGIISYLRNNLVILSFLSLFLFIYRYFIENDNKNSKKSGK